MGAFQLTENQIDSFKQEGYLVLRDFLDTSLVEAWREQFWVQAGGSLEDKDSWPVGKNIGNLKLTPELGGLLDVKSIVEQLGGEQFNGGAFVYWPCSHRDAHRYFLDFPDQIEGTFREIPEWDEHNWGIFQGDSTKPPQEFIAKAGDVILWHGWLSHSGSANIQESPRIGLFSRWTHKNDADIRKNLPQELWDYWIV